jgi:hypothetical protein
MYILFIYLYFRPQFSKVVTNVVFVLAEPNPILIDVYTHLFQNGRALLKCRNYLLRYNTTDLAFLLKADPDAYSEKQNSSTFFNFKMLFYVRNTGATSIR